MRLLELKNSRFIFTRFIIGKKIDCLKNISSAFVKNSGGNFWNEYLGSEHKIIIIIIIIIVLVI